MSQKNIIILVIGVLLIAGISGYIVFSKQYTYFGSQNNQKPTPSPTLQQTQKITPQPSPTPQANKVSVCGTYKSEEFGFEFTCPEGWYVSTSDLEPKFGYQIYFVNDKSILINESGFGDFISGVDFSVEDNSKLLTLQQWIDQNIGFDGTSKSVQIAGVDGVRISGVGEISGEESVMVIFPKGDRVFVFLTGGIYITALDHMVSTFKFLR